MCLLLNWIRLNPSLSKAVQASLGIEIGREGQILCSKILLNCNIKENTRVGRIQGLEEIIFLLCNFSVIRRKNFETVLCHVHHNLPPTSSYQEASILPSQPFQICSRFWLCVSCSIECVSSPIQSSCNHKSLQNVRGETNPPVHCVREESKVERFLLLSRLYKVMQEP